ncbi:response regulator [Mucilaginibacter ginsenosidivorans]|uniref:Response regulator transcription factor n=1 Tax=Mucilaginibacter ginsenosidivorans TaxID=398053 RepID=A0A5B8UU96_9SPHI|nr:response regulator transcription factor [Mucilaginibacter ginsenosidivorans]QEC62492.1 response regulator transcription factor [Mucilaginibacter ginsenosidivorans]
MKTSLAIVDDHKLFLKSLAVLVATFDDYEVLFCSDNGKDFTEKVNPKRKPDIVLLDNNMPDMNGFDTVLWLKAHYPDIRVIILSMNHNEETVIKMVRNGISGYVLKDAEIEEFRSALDTVRSGGLHYPRFVTNYLVKHTARVAETSPVSPLRGREIEFLRLAATELTYKEIADRMCLSAKTIDGYREDLFRKLEVKNRVGLAMYAVHHQLI